MTIRDAAAPERRGLLQPLLKRYQAWRLASLLMAFSVRLLVDVICMANSLRTTSSCALHTLCPSPVLPCQARRCSSAVFALPAAQAIIQFKCAPAALTINRACQRSPACSCQCGFQTRLYDCPQESEPCMPCFMLKPPLAALLHAPSPCRWATFARRLLMVELCWFLLWWVGRRGLKSGKHIAEHSRGSEGPFARGRQLPS